MNPEYFPKFLKGTMKLMGVNIFWIIISLGAVVVGKRFFNIYDNMALCLVFTLSIALCLLIDKKMPAACVTLFLTKKSKIKVNL